MKKAIITTSANPFHYGHLDIYNRAKDIFDEVTVIIAQNSNKTIDRELIYSIKPYNIPFTVLDKNSTVADYCKKHDINYIVRGIRTENDLNYELNLNNWNKKLNKNIKTIFLPAEQKYANLSSSVLRELLKYEKFDIVKEYMNEESMLRYYNKSPKYIVYFGKSCSGKSTYLKNLTKYSPVDIDKFLFSVFESEYPDIDNIKKNSKKLFEENKLDEIQKNINFFCNEKFWNRFFNILNTSYVNADTNKIYLDFAAVGNYFDTIPLNWRSKMKFIELYTSEEKRKVFSEKKGFTDKLEKLNKMYQAPKIIDERIEI